MCIRDSPRGPGVGALAYRLDNRRATLPPAAIGGAQIRQLPGNHACLNPQAELFVALDAGLTPDPPRSVAPGSSGLAKNVRAASIEVSKGSTRWRTKERVDQ